MAIKDWSTTPASNDTVTDATYGDINWAENQAPNTVNNSSRSEMAHVRAFYENIEWRDYGHTVTRTGNTTFEISGDYSDDYVIRRRLKCTDSSTIYAIITDVDYNVTKASYTTVTVATDSGNLSASLSAVALGPDPRNNPIHETQLSGAPTLCPHKNLVVKNGTTSANQVTVTADELVLTNSSGEFLKISSVSITDADITTDASGGGTSGFANGYTRGADEFAYVWVVGDGTNAYVLFDEVGTAPDMTGFTGYFYGLVGAVRNVSSAFRTFHQVNNKVVLPVLTQVLSSGSSTTYTSTLTTALSTVVPANANEVFGTAFVSQASDADVDLRIASSAAGLGENVIYMLRSISGATPASSVAGGTFNVLLIESQALYYKVGNASEIADIYISGWTY